MTRANILEQFDYTAREFTFPMMDNGYVYPADVRLSIYRDSTRWLMIIETLGAYSPRLSGCDSFQNCLHLFGNSLGRKAGTMGGDTLFPIDSLTGDPLFEDQYDWYINPRCSSLGIRTQAITFDASQEKLALQGILLLEPPKIDPPALLRSLLPTYRELLLASETDLSARNDHQLPLWFRLNEWFHPDLASEELPSECETFQMLADAIESGNLSDYCPTKSPNTDWKNWPEGGTL